MDEKIMIERIFNFLKAWNMIKNQNIELVFENGDTYEIGDNIELIYNTEKESLCFNP